MPRNELRTLNLPIAEELARRTGVRPRVRMQECEPYAIAGRLPKLVFSPKTPREAGQTIALLAAEGASVIIRGAGTKQFRPPAPEEVEAVLDTTRCKGVLDYVPADLTVTVAAGTPFAQLQEALRAHHQFFPADPPFTAEATVGGVLSSRVSGSLRQGYGSVRDNVLGMRVCLSDGSVAFTGSRVVKSVAGYDIAKLFVGAQGTLGFIAEVTLKVAPLPAEERAVVASFSSTREACVAASRLAQRSLFPLATVMLDPASVRKVRALAGDGAGRLTLVVRCGGSRAGVRELVDGVSGACRESGSKSVAELDRDTVAFAWTDIAELCGGTRYPAAKFATCKLVCLPEHVAEVCDFATSQLDEPALAAHPASGIVFMAVDVVQVENPLQRLQAFGAACLAREWNIEYLSVPAELGALRQPVPATTPLLLMRQIKAALDSTGTFDPGRFFAGI